MHHSLGGDCSAQDHKRLQRVVTTTQSIGQSSLPLHPYQLHVHSELLRESSQHYQGPFLPRSFPFLSSPPLGEKDTKASKHQNQEQLLLHCSQTTEQSTYKLWPPISQTTSWNPGTFVACTFSVTVTLYSALFHFSLHFLFDLYFGTRGNNKQIQVSKIMYELLIWNLHRKTSCFVPRSQ